MIYIPENIEMGLENENETRDKIKTKIVMKALNHKIYNINNLILNEPKLQNKLKIVEKKHVKRGTGNSSTLF